MYLKLRCQVVFILLSLNVFTSNAQSQVVISKDIRVTQDSVSFHLLVNSLNGFLAQKQLPARNNDFILKQYLPETAILLEELKSVEVSVPLKDNNFYKPNLTNLVELNNGVLLIQLSYIGIKDNTPLLRTSYRFMAVKQGSKFYFYSPLQLQTTSWKKKTLAYITCYYKDTLNIAEINSYRKTLDFYRTKLKTPVLPIKLYYCDHLPEVLEILGIDYVADYNGIKSIDRTVHENGIDLVVNGGYAFGHRFDPHDLWHERLRVVMNASIINKPVDEGCAYLYGGSWGYSWQEIATRFHKYCDTTIHPDWLTLYTGLVNFEPGQKPLKIAYVLNALIAQKIEKKKLGLVVYLNYWDAENASKVMPIILQHLKN